MREPVSTKEEDSDLHLRMSPDLHQCAVVHLYTLTHTNYADHTHTSTHREENRNTKKRRKIKEMRKRKKKKEGEGKAKDTAGLQNHCR